VLTLLLPYAAALVAALVLVWNVALAGRLARIDEAPRNWATLTGLLGLLLIPAVLIRVVGSSLVLGRTIAALAWFWPVVATLVALQAGMTLAQRLGVRALVLPIALYDTLVALGAWVELASGTGTPLPAWLHALPTAVTSAIGYVAGPAALASPFALAPPLLAPAFRARWAINATVRATVALGAFVGVVAVASELPQAMHAVRSFDAYTLVPLRERPEGRPLDVGLRMLGTVGGMPHPQALAWDRALADSADVAVVGVVVTPGTPARGLDSLGRVLDDLRADSVRIVATIGWDREEALRARFAPTSWERSRVAAVDQVVRRLRPDVLVPIAEPYGLGARTVGRLPVARWQALLAECARTARTLRPAMRVLHEASAYDARDSVLAAWAGTRASGLDGVAYVFTPGFRGGSSLEAKLQAVDRWRRARATPAREWVTLAAGNPWVHGELAQDRAIWGVLSWASARPTVEGVLVGDAGDYDTRRGLRGPGGRLRPATASLRRAIRALAPQQR
jgi:hypothetical protein